MIENVRYRIHRRLVLVTSTTDRATGARYERAAASSDMAGAPQQRGIVSRQLGLPAIGPAPATPP